ncbi:MAG: hypothetical protein FWG13_05280 [Leptospirales bacterium]|nr:hypothetical protein [Leptospirales bacterium]
MKITHYLAGMFAAALFMGIPALVQKNVSAQEAAPVLKLGLYADTSSQRVVDIRANGVLRGFKGEPSADDRNFAAESTVFRSYETNVRYVYYYYAGKFNYSGDEPHNIYLLHGTYRITGKRLIFSITGEPPLKSYGYRENKDAPLSNTHPFEGWEGRTLVYTILDSDSFQDADGNSWIRLCD